MHDVPSIHQTVAGARSSSSAVRADFRRRRGREFSEFILARAEHLPPADRELIQAIYSTGRPVKAVAQLMGAPSRSLGRRCKRIVNRLLTPVFAFVVLHEASWSPAMRGVAQKIIIEGRTQRQAAAALGLTYHTVRRVHDAIVAMTDGAGDVLRLSTREALKPANATASALLAQGADDRRDRGGPLRAVSVAPSARSSVATTRGQTPSHAPRSEVA